MVKLLVKGFSLVLLLYLAMLSVAQYDNKHKISDDNVLRLMAAESESEIDYLFVGSSYTYSGIIPSVFDSIHLKTFNLGIATSGPFFNEIVINDFLSVHKKPNYILIAIAYTTFSEVASDSWDNYPIHRYLSNSLSNENIFIRYTDTKTYFQMLRRSFKKGTENIFNGKAGFDTLVLSDLKKTKGYFKSIESTSNLKINQERELFTPYLKSNYSERKENALLDLIARLKSRGIKVILLEPPTYQLGNFFSEEYKKRYSEFVYGLSDKSITILKDTVNVYDSSCFRNTDHLNFKGASVYTNYLKKSIKFL